LLIGIYWLASDAAHESDPDERLLTRQATNLTKYHLVSPNANTQDGSTRPSEIARPECAGSLASPSRVMVGMAALDLLVRVAETRASDEFRAVVVEELGHRARGAAGDPLEGVGRMVVLASEDRPLARDEQFSRPRRDTGADEAIE
jgi:hypothetical protein